MSDGPREAPPSSVMSDRNGTPQDSGRFAGTVRGVRPFHVGYLSHGGHLPRWPQFERDCLRCGEKYSGTLHQRHCRACFGTPEHTKWLKEQQAKRMKSWERRKAKGRKHR